MSSFITTRFLGLPVVGECKSQAESIESQVTRSSDEELLFLVSKGNQQALGVLFERYVGTIRSIATRILRDPTEAEDLCQDLFLFIERKCAIFDRTKSTARSWIIQMAYHRAFERRRYLTARRFYSRMEIESSTGQVVGVPTRECDYSAEAVFGRNGLSTVLRSLSDDQRETLRLHLFEGYTFAEIGQRMGQTLGNIRNHYYRGLDKLRRQMLRNTVSAGQRDGK